MKTFIVRPYFGYDCNSWSGFNNGRFEQEIEISASSLEEAADLVAVQFMEENQNLDYTTFPGDNIVQWIYEYIYNDQTISKDQYLDMIDNDNIDQNKLGYLYQYIDFDADVQEINN